MLHERVERLLFDRHHLPVKTANWLLDVLRYPFALVRDLLTGELNLRAMGLVYTTLLSLVPLAAFAFAVLKGLGVHRDLEPLIYEFLRPIGVRATELTAQFMTFVDNVRGDVLGSVGLAFLLYTVISTIQKLEEAFNFAWHVERPRSIMRRVSEYLSLMVVGTGVHRHRLQPVRRARQPCLHALADGARALRHASCARSASSARSCS